MPKFYAGNQACPPTFYAGDPACLPIFFVTGLLTLNIRKQAGSPAYKMLVGKYGIQHKMFTNNYLI